MPETPEEFRQRVERIDSKFFEDLEKRAAPYRVMSFEYDKLAIEYSHKGFQNLTYLNGGALVAIPTAMAFFKAEVSKSDVLITAGFFVAGLLLVVFAQLAAFFTMAKRAEAQQRRHLEQAHRIAALAFPHQTPANLDNLTKADEQHGSANKRLRHSDVWRGAGLLFFGLSLVAFVFGCGWGGYTVIAAKERNNAAMTVPGNEPRTSP